MPEFVHLPGTPSSTGVPLRALAPTLSRLSLSALMRTGLIPPARRHPLVTSIIPYLVLPGSTLDGRHYQGSATLAPGRVGLIQSSVAFGTAQEMATGLVRM
jgi:hypothetical protein